MSTKSSIASGENFQLYDALFDGGVYLQVDNAENASLKIVDGRTFVRVLLPKALVERLKLDDVQLLESTGTFDEDPLSNEPHHAKK